MLQQQQQSNHFPQNFLCYDSRNQQMAPPQGSVNNSLHKMVQQPRTEICKHWAKDGRCPCRGCPYAASHTAQNSPRYSKFVPQTVEQATARPNALVIEDPVERTRPNALVIKDPSPRDKAPPARTSAALEIKEPP